MTNPKDFLFNKETDFIGLSRLLKDIALKGAARKTFNNTESPIVCCKYNKPVKDKNFNYNNITMHCFDLLIVEQTPNLNVMKG